MRFFLLLSAFLIFPFLSHTQNSEFISKNKIVYFKSGLIGENNFFQKEFKKLGFNVVPEMHKIYTNVDKSGMVHTKYRQYYKGLEVTGADYVLHSKSGKVVKTTGLLFPGLDLDIRAEIAADNVKEIAVNYAIAERMTQEQQTGDDPEDYEAMTPVLCIVDKAFPDFSGQYILAYRIIVQNNNIERPYKKEIYIDANTGKKIFSEDKIHFESVPAKGESLYYGVVDFVTDSIGPSKYLLQDKERGNGIKVRNADNWQIFSDEDNYWEFEKEGERSAIDAYYATLAYYDFLKERFNRNSIDNAGFALEARVNVKGLVNAYWDGTGSIFGSGNCYRFGPLTSISIVGHEFTHGLTDYTSDLIYRKESGALNESISDIFGEALAYHLDSVRFSWELGKVIARHDTIRPIRSMRDPNATKDPKYYKGENWVTDAIDNYGVHSNSGVFNYWFYLLSEGGGGVNETGDTFDVKAIGIDKAIDIVYQLEANYLNMFSGYNDAYRFSLEAVKDLFGDGSIEMQNVLEAWKAVGIPKELSWEDKFNFEFIYNGEKNVDELLCISDFENFYFDIVNLNDTVFKAGIPMNIDIYFGKIKYSGTKIFIDSVFIDTVLTEDWKKNDTMRFTLNFDSDKYSMSNIILYLQFDVQLGAGSGAVNFQDIQNFQITNELYNLTGSIRFWKKINCQLEQTISDIGLGLYNGGCAKYDEALDTIYMIVENGTNDYKVVLEPYRVYNGRSYIFNILNSYFDFEQLDDISSYSIKIYYKHGDKEIFIAQKSLQDILVKSVYLDKKLTFSSSDDFYKYMTVDKSGYLISHEILLGKLHVFSDKTPEKLEDCLPYEDYFQQSRYNRMNITLCVDLDTFEKPYIAFDLEMKDSYHYTDNSDYSHMVDIFQNNDDLSGIMTSTGNAQKHIKLNLDKASSKSKVQFKFLSIGTNIYVDNVEIGDWSKDAVVDIEKNNSFIFNNPVQDYLRLTPVDMESSWSVRLYNAAGYLLYSKNNITGEWNIEMPYPQGMYFFRIIDKKGNVFRGKVVRN